MSKHELNPSNISLVAEFLSRMRHIPPEREGWYSGYEIQKGIKDELGVQVRAYKVLPSLDFLMSVDPPVVEDIWMLDDDNGVPDTSHQYAHPNRPEKARRFYRALGGIIDYAVNETPCFAGAPQAV